MDQAHEAAAPPVPGWTAIAGRTRKVPGYSRPQKGAAGGDEIRAVRCYLHQSRSPGPEVRLDPVLEQAFREAAVACLDSLYGFALALCHNAVAAEDLVQETYLRALRAPHKAEPDQGLRSWMFAILHNIWRN